MSTVVTGLLKQVVISLARCRCRDLSHSLQRYHYVGYTGSFEEDAFVCTCCVAIEAPAVVYLVRYDMNEYVSLRPRAFSSVPGINE